MVLDVSCNLAEVWTVSFADVVLDVFTDLLPDLFNGRVMTYGNKIARSPKR
jgi:hypothetical protein